MGLLDRIERKMHGRGIPNLTLLLISGQVILYVMQFAQPDLFMRLALIAERVMAGEVWRLATFMFLPPFTNPVFALFGWYMFYLMGTALEEHWGVFRYNLFLLIACVATAAVAFATPDASMSNVFIHASVFLAFAFLYPEFEILIFFVLPVKVKWLAWLTWAGILYKLVAGDWPTRLVELAAISNFLLFFGADIYWRMKTGRRRMTAQAKKLSGKREAFHRCTVCGITDLTHPHADFRYCPKCEGAVGYCEEHIQAHEHVRKAAAVE